MFKILVITLLFTSIRSLPQGAPPSVCKTLKPFHGGGIEAQQSASPFVIAPAARSVGENGQLQVTLGSKQGVNFGGFMLHARRVDTAEVVGNFININEKSKGIKCSEENDTVTHESPSKKGPLEFTWVPPSGFLGEVIFKGTVAQDYATFWVGFDSPSVRVVRDSEVDPNDKTTVTNLRPTTTPPFYTTESSGQTQHFDDPFYKGCFESKGCFGAPEGCVATKDCKAVVATTVKGDKYEFEIKAPSNTAKYVAVGLSDDDKMGDDSVIECVREGNGARAYMSKTIPRPKLGLQRLQRPLSGIELISFNITDGMLYCKVRREAKTDVDGTQFDLVNKKYFLLVAAGTKLKGISAGFHDIEYLATGESRFLSDVSRVGGASKLLLRLHGAFMLIAWVGTASIGILLARYYRQTWVGSQMCGKDQWFTWHRIFMVTTWALTMAAFIIIFVELQAWSTESNPHAILGLITTIICFLQPIGAYFRPHPGTPKRPIFNWIHWLGGNVAHILAIVTIFFAVKLNKAELPEWMDWILVAFVAFHVIMHLILSLYSWLQILGCISDRSAERRVTSFPMKDLSGGRNSGLLDRKADAPHSGVRKSLLGIYIFIIILLVVALVVVAVLAPIEQSWKNFKNTMMQH